MKFLIAQIFFKGQEFSQFRMNFLSIRYYAITPPSIRAFFATGEFLFCAYPGYFSPWGDLCSDCEACNCNPLNTQSQTCNNVTGACPCKPKYGGLRCETCLPGYYNHPPDNPDACVSCECNPSGSVSMECDVTGKCKCRRRYFGVKCEQLEIGTFFV